MQQCINVQLQPDCVTCKCSNVLIQSLCSGRFYIPAGLYLYTACLVCVYCMADDASEKLVVWQVPVRILGLLHIWWDLVYSVVRGLLMMAMVQQRRRRRRGMKAKCIFYRLLQETWLLKTSRKYWLMISAFIATLRRATATIIPAIETWGNFLLTTDPSETRMVPFSWACLLLVEW